MATKTKSCVKTKEQRHWDICEGNCSSCWPLVYQCCKSPKKVNRTLIKLDEQEERDEEMEQTVNLFNKAESQGYLIVIKKA